MTKFLISRREILAALRKSRRRLVAALLITLAGFGVATVRWFVMPQQGMPTRVSKRRTRA